MTVALSNDFLLAYSSVQKGHQKKVREFIELFRERPDSPGIHYEPIERRERQEPLFGPDRPGLPGGRVPPGIVGLRPDLGGSPRRGLDVSGRHRRRFKSTRSRERCKY